jgi:dTMP kinase
MQKKGFFITIEGPEGAGKSTQLQKLAEYLESIGATCVRTREPGGTPLAEDLRNVVKEYNGNEKVFPETELLLMEAARSQHMNVLVLPALAEGKVVICDRFSDSTLAYQGYARKLDMNIIEKLNLFASGNRVPDLTLLMDLTTEDGFARTRKRTSTLGQFDRFEVEKIDFHQKVRNGFLTIAKENPTRVKVINAARSIDEIFADVKAAVDEALASTENFVKVDM